MSNITINKQEINFIKEAILKKYGDGINYPFEKIISDLTGHIKHFERLSEHMQEYLNNEEVIFTYAKLITESPFKIIIRRWINDRDDLKKVALRELKGSLSANVLRKLIFYSQHANEQTYKEYFILACYLFIGVDRSEKIKLFLLPPTGSVEKTVPPTYFYRGNKKDEHKENNNKCYLKPLKDNDEIIDKEKKILEFEGEHIVLNRSNIDPQNNTITSKVQAELKLIDNEWYIDNGSLLKTTFIQVLRPTKINKGDIILLGNKRFLFDE